MNSATLRRARARIAPLVRGHEPLSNALRAAAIATSMSPTSPFGYVPTTTSCPGLTRSKRLPDDASTDFPSIVILKSICLIDVVIVSLSLKFRWAFFTKGVNSFGKIFGCNS